MPLDMNGEFISIINSTPPHGQSLWTEIALANQASNILDRPLVIANLSQCPSYNEVRKTEQKCTSSMKTSFAPFNSHDILVRLYFI
jgi:hypothetical protein